MANSGILPGGFGGSQLQPIYVNGVQVHASAWDLGFEFQLVSPAGQDAEGNTQVVLQPMARILMSPQHGKAFAGILQTLVANWEQQYGALPDVDSIPGVSVKETKSE